MELQTSLLIVSREFSLYGAVKKTPPAGDFRLFFCRPDEDCLSIVRELENVLESASMMCKKDFIDVPNLPKHLRDFEAPEGGLSFLRKENLSTLESLEKEHIAYLLKVTKKNLRRTAKILGISRTTLYNKLAKFKLSR